MPPPVPLQHNTGGHLHGVECKYLGQETTATCAKNPRLTTFRSVPLIEPLLPNLLLLPEHWRVSCQTSTLNPEPYTDIQNHDPKTPRPASLRTRVEALKATTQPRLSNIPYLRHVPYFIFGILP